MDENKIKKDEKKAHSHLIAVASAVLTFIHIGFGVNMLTQIGIVTKISIHL